MKNNRSNVVAIIPAYNEENCVAKVILGTMRHVDSVVVCDDGSTDMTYTIATALNARVVRHGEKRGKGEAFKTLYKEAMELNPDILVTIDGDGQHDPDQIPLLVKPIEAGTSDVVVGSRYVDGGEMDAPLYRRLGLRVINYMYRKVAGVKVNDTQSGFRAYSKKAFEYLMEYDSKGYGVEGEQLAIAAKNGLRVVEVPVSVMYNGLERSSKKTPLLHGADLVLTLFRLAVEERPLMYLGLPGLALTLIGMMLGLYLLWMFNITQHFSIPVAMFMMLTLTVGLLLVIFATTLHGLKRINERLKRFNGK